MVRPGKPLKKVLKLKEILHDVQSRPRFWRLDGELKKPTVVFR